MQNVILIELFTKFFNKISKVIILNHHALFDFTRWLIENQGELNGWMRLLLLSPREVSDIYRLQVKQILFKNNLTVELLFRYSASFTRFELIKLSNSHLCKIPQEQNPALIKTNEQCLHTFH